VTAPPLALTLGDPAGVGPEIVAKAWSALRASGPAFFAIGDAWTLVGQVADRVRPISRPSEATRVFPEALPVLDLPLDTPVQPGCPTPQAGTRVIEWIETAVRLALAGEAAGIVTAPIAKSVLYEAGFRFPGHTEFIGELTRSAPLDGPRGPVMMLTAADLRVTLATIHTPLAAVPAQVTRERIVEVGLVTAHALRCDFGIDTPRIAVAGLNPHAGESGALGTEEIETVGPAVHALQALGVDVRGPAPADTLFHAEARRGYDAALCLYHDQALIPVKMLDFWGGVNLTLGLPIVRASPDHGTAFDIAGKGVARPESMIAAIRLAGEIASRRAGAA
jgi:4-hydroxythreonine-4-phosphate dehydrogenase